MISRAFYTLIVGLVIIAMTACQSEVEQNDTTNLNEEETTGMLQHTVYFYLNDDVTSEQAQEFEQGLKDLLTISAVYKSELGIPGDTESRGVTDHSFAYSIYTWFENLEDYKAYDEHPEHLEFIDTYSPLWADVKVYDAELIEK